MIRALLDKRVVRFLGVGVLNSAFGFLVFSAVVWVGHGTVMALLAGNAAGLVFNFFSTGGLVFRTLALHRLPKFITCYVSMLLVNYALLKGLTPFVDSQIVAQAVLTLPMAGLSYAIMTFWVYKTSTDKDSPAGD
ncbi:MAG: GtrA family protein [Polaromonas sp.]